MFGGGPGEVAERTRAAVTGYRAAGRGHGEALPRPGRGRAEHRRRAGHDRRAARLAGGKRELPVPAAVDARVPAGDALARALPGDRRAPDRVSVARRGHRPAAPPDRLPRRDGHGQPRGRGRAGPLGHRHRRRALGPRRGRPDPHDRVRELERGVPAAARPGAPLPRFRAAACASPPPVCWRSSLCWAWLAARSISSRCTERVLPCRRLQIRRSSAPRRTCRPPGSARACPPARSAAPGPRPA